MKIINTKVKIQLYFQGFLFLVWSILIVTSIFLMGLVVQAISQSDWNQFLLYLYIEIGAATASTLINLGTKVLQNNIKNKLQITYQNHLLKNASAFQDEKMNLNKGSFNSVIFETIPKIIDNRFFAFISLIDNAFTFVIALVILFYYSWIIALSSLVLLVLSIILNAINANKYSKANLKIEEETNYSNNRINLFFEAFRKFFFFKKTKQLQKHLQKENQGFAKRIFKMYFRLERLNSLFLFVILLFQVAMEAIVVSLYILDFVPIATFATVPFLSGLMASSFAQATDGFSSFRGFKKTQDKFIPLKKQEKTYLPLPIDKISFKDFNVSFENKKDLYLKDFSFEFKKGANYLIQGKSGVGKSTLFYPLFYNNYAFKGKVFVNNKELSSFDKKQLYASLNYLESERFLFEGKVKDNITLFANYSKKQLLKSLSLAYLPKSILAKNTKNASQGEKQRIALASVLIRNPKWLILDEALSNVDAKTFSLIENNLQKEQINLIHISHSKNITKEIYDQKITF